MVAARASPDPIAQWIALVDEAERLLRSAPCVPGGLAGVEPAIAALVAHEHSMTPVQRHQAREQIWRRDHASEPLPDTRAWWAGCTCRACRLARGAAPAEHRETAWHAQARTLQRQRHKTNSTERTAKLCG